MIPPEQAERKRFELWYNNHYDMELITGPDDVEAAWEIWKAAIEDTPVNPVGYVGLTSEGEPTKFRTGNFGSGHPVYLSPVATTAEADSVKRCSWWKDMADWDGNTWESDCGACWVFIDEGPVQNEMNYCPKCGRKLSQLPTPPQEQ